MEAGQTTSSLSVAVRDVPSFLRLAYNVHSTQCQQSVPGLSKVSHHRCLGSSDGEWLETWHQADVHRLQAHRVAGSPLVLGILYFVFKASLQSLQLLKRTFGNERKLGNEVPIQRLAVLSFTVA